WQAAMMPRGWDQNAGSDAQADTVYFRHFEDDDLGGDPFPIFPLFSRYPDLSALVQRLGSAPRPLRRGDVRGKMNPAILDVDPPHVSGAAFNVDILSRLAFIPLDYPTLKYAFGSARRSCQHKAADQQKRDLRMLRPAP